MLHAKRWRETAVRPALAIALVLGLATGAAGQESETSGTEDGSDPATERVQEILDAEGTDDGSGPLPLPGEGPPESDPEAVAIVDRYLEAIGGRDTLAAVRDRMTRFENTKFQPTGETKAVLTLYMKRGYLFREEWEIEGFQIGDKPLAFVQIYNGPQEQGWVQMFGTVSPLEGRTLGVFVWDKYIDDFFMHWKDDGYTLELDGKGLVDGEKTDIVRASDFSGRHIVRYFFSQESGLLLKKEWTDSTRRQPMKKEQYYKMYRPIAFSDGSGQSVRFALQRDILVDGDLDTERIYTQVKFNSGLDDALFAKPEGTPFDEAQAGELSTSAEGQDVPEDVPLPQGLREGSATRRTPVTKEPAESDESESQDSPD